jgi:large subunit ribosomal protein L1
MAATITKRIKANLEKIDKDKVYSAPDALEVLKSISNVKFIESVDIAVQLGIDARKSDQLVRGSTVLPNGTGKDMRVAVFAQGKNAEIAKEAGAEYVGFEDLAELIKQKLADGKLDIDIVIATPDAMRIVGQLGRVLGPKGLMPNPKVGTVTPDVKKAVDNAKAGQVAYRTDKAGIIHCSIGRANFEVNALKENLLRVMDDLRKAKPSAAKGVYFKKLVLSTTMGPGLQVEVNSLIS